MFDAAGVHTRDAIRHDLGLPVRDVRIVRVTNICGPLSAENAERVRRDLLADPVSERSAINAPVPGKADWIVEVGFRPGVTDNTARTVADGLEDTLGHDARELEVSTATQYRISGRLTRKDIDHIARGLLANELIERWVVLSGPEFISRGGEALEPPTVFETIKPTVARYDLEVPDNALVELSRKGMLALSLEEMRAIQAHYRDSKVRARREKLGLDPQPTDVEL